MIIAAPSRDPSNLVNWPHELSRFPVNFALTSHGLGHATRTVALARELASRHPEIEVVFSTRVDKAWIAPTLGLSSEYRPVGYEPGVMQKSCFELDVHETRNAYREFFADREKRLEEERTFLRTTSCSVVVSDIPAPGASRPRSGDSGRRGIECHLGLDS